MWTLTYKLELVKRSELILPPHILYTDYIYAMVPFSYSKTLLYLPHCVYCYRLGRAGQSAEKKVAVSHLDERIAVAGQLCLFYESHKELCSGYILGMAAASYGWMIRTIFWDAVTVRNLQKIKQCEKKMKRRSPDIYMAVEKRGKLGLFIKLLRRTRYVAYWGLKLIPGGWPYKI